MRSHGPAAPRRWQGAGRLWGLSFCGAYVGVVDARPPPPTQRFPDERTPIEA